MLVAIGGKDFEQLEKSQKANTLEQLKRGRWYRYSRDEIKPVRPEAVSYTHLTLPTSDLVKISEVPEQ